MILIFSLKKNLNKIDQDFKKRLRNAFKFSKESINKFILLLRKSVYPYQYMGDQKNNEKCNETTLPEKDNLDSDLNMEEITD